jgi:hypothetical protein
MPTEEGVTHRRRGYPMATVEGRALIARASPLQALLAKLDAVVEARSQRAGDPNLEPLDRAVCEAARRVLFGYVDVAGWLSEPDRPLADKCRAALEQATKCLNPKAYTGAGKYFHSVNDKACILRRMAQGEKIETVLGEKVEAALQDALAAQDVV